MDEETLRRIMREELMAYDLRRRTAPELSEKRRAAAASRWGKTISGSRSTRLALARKRGTHTEKEWFAMLEIHDYKCLACGADGVNKDHIIPIHQQGSSDGIENIQPLCRKCNAQKGGENRDLRAPDWRAKLDKWLMQNASKILESSIDGSTSYIREIPPEKKKNASKTPAKEKPPVDEISPGSKAFLRYAAAYKLRYGAFPIRNAKVNALLVQLVKRLGAEAPDVAEAYVGLDEPLYVRSGHAVELLVRDCEKIRTTWATGRTAPGNGSGKPWWETWPGIEHQGDDLGVDRDDEHPQAYRQAVYRAAFAAGKLPDHVARKVGVL